MQICYVFPKKFNSNCLEDTHCPSGYECIKGVYGSGIFCKKLGNYRHFERKIHGRARSMDTTMMDSYVDNTIECTDEELEAYKR